MNSIWHFIISIIKSGIRILGGLWCLKIAMYISDANIKTAIMVLAWSYVLAEVLGVLEEVGDKR